MGSNGSAVSALAGLLAESAVKWSGTIAVGAMSLALSGVYWGFTQQQEAALRSFQELKEAQKELKLAQNDLKSELRNTAVDIKSSNEQLSANILASSNSNATRIDLVHARTDFLMDKAVNGAHTSAVDHCEAGELRRKHLPRLRLRTALALPVRVESGAALQVRATKAREGPRGVYIDLAQEVLWSECTVV